MYIELALGYILKDEYLEEIGKKDTVILTGGLFSLLDMTQTKERAVLIISYLIIPLVIILILRPKDVSKKRIRVSVRSVDHNEFKIEWSSYRVYIGENVLQRLKKSKELLLRILLLGMLPIHVYQVVQNSCDPCKKTGARRLKRMFWVSLALVSSISAVICSVIIAAICLLLIPSFSTIVLVGWSPYCSILWYFKLVLRRTRRRARWLIILFLISMFIAAFFVLFFSQGKSLLIVLNPFIWLTFTVSGPLVLSLFSSRFLIKMWGYTVMGLIYNAEIAAPIAVFFFTLAPYLRDRYFDSKNKCRRVKEIISQEWQRGIKESLDSKKLNEQEKPKVVDDAIPKKLFWYVSDSDEYQVFPLENEALRLLRHVAITFFTAFLALCTIFFSTNSYKISTVDSTIAVFVSAKIPMLLLRETDNFNGWKKIKTKRIIRKSVEEYIDKKRWLEPAKP